MRNMNTVVESPLVFECQNEQLFGIVHAPQQPDSQFKKTGVLIVVGGPQYRVGSHRQFLLLARRLAENGYPVMRFDYRGMGDSTGKLNDFENVNYDIAAAIDNFVQVIPGLEKIIIWGLCDAASAAMFYAPTDPRVKGLVLLNPWVRTDQGEAKAFLKKYYFQRFLSKDLWLKLIKGGINPVQVISSLANIVKKAFKKESQSNEQLSLPERMLAGLKAYNGDIMLILSGNDLVAEEFKNLVNESADWKSALASTRTKTVSLSEANHTFSSVKWRDQVETWTLEWLEAR